MTSEGFLPSTGSQLLIKKINGSDFLSDWMEADPNPIRSDSDSDSDFF